MKSHTRFVHQFVRVLRLEELFVALSRRLPVFRKFIPVPAEYTKNETRIVRRDNTFFKVRLYDYMQWHLFADVPDNAWKLAIPYLANGAFVFDIGANSGHFSLKLARYSRLRGVAAEIHAFEPNPKVCAAFLENLRLNNGHTTSVTLHEFGLGEVSEKRFFDFKEENLGAGRITMSSKTGTISITIRRLDEIIAELKPSKIAFIKIDVEGFEPEVLNGAWQTIETFKPAIYFEVTPSWYRERGHSEKKLFERLVRLGYNLRVEVNDRLKPFVSHEFDNTFQFNVLASINGGVGVS